MRKTRPPATAPGRRYPVRPRCEATPRPTIMSRWTTEQSADLYLVEKWGKPYVHVSS